MPNKLFIFITLIHFAVLIKLKKTNSKTWSASLDINCNGLEKPNCEATILTNFVLLTSAGCVEGCDVVHSSDTIKVKVGNDPPSKTNTAKVNNIHIHDRHRLSDREVNDVGLLILDRKIKLKDGQVERVSLRKNLLIKALETNSTGNTMQFRNNKMSVMDKADCENLLQYKIGNNMMCGRGFGNALRADDQVLVGGALTDKKGRLIGIKSAQIVNTALFTDITKYVDWIQQNVTDLTEKAIYIKGDPDEAAHYAHELLNSLKQDLNLVSKN